MGNVAYCGTGCCSDDKKEKEELNFEGDIHKSNKKAPAPAHLEK